jgi:hypothetical protein
MLLNARALGMDGAVYDLTLGMTQTCSGARIALSRVPARLHATQAATSLDGSAKVSSESAVSLASMMNADG